MTIFEHKRFIRNYIKGFFPNALVEFGEWSFGNLPNPVGFCIIWHNPWTVAEFGFSETALLYLSDEEVFMLVAHEVAHGLDKYSRSKTSHGKSFHAIVKKLGSTSSFQSARVCLIKPICELL